MKIKKIIFLTSTVVTIHLLKSKMKKVKKRTVVIQMMVKKMRTSKILVRKIRNQQVDMTMKMVLENH